ncbi:TolC family outer membrane protein [uncultured Mailhella sp.]|uniref:TolC family outer membrane protein n=1 Tax=uncultured Mailhella sp. TaxID=1981031 RepID=UPI0025CC8625|nr:TolC family outer membrane protein [uncultured Mailhella sp.]
MRTSFSFLFVSGCLGLLLFLPSAHAAERDGAIPLKESIEAMLRNNNSLKAIQENRSAAGYEIDRAKAGYGPRVDLTARGGFGKLTDSTTRSYNYDEAAPYSSASLLVTQPLWDGWLTRGRVREAEATYRSLDHRVMDNANSLALDAIIAHVDVLRRQQIYQLAQDNVSRHEEILEKAREREAQGVDTMADVSQAQSRLSRARSTLTEARASLRIGEDTYTRLTRHSAMSLGPVNLPSKMFSGPEEVLKAAQKGNPKVAAYMEDVKAANAVREQARSAYSPSLSIEAGPSYSDRDGKSELWTAEVGVAAVVRWNLFNSGADVAESKAAAARIRQSRRVLYDYMDDLELNVRESWTEYLSAQKQLQFYREAIEYNKTTRDAYEEQFVMGERSLLDVLDAENELFNSSTQAATALGNTLIAAYRMKALAGDLLPGFNISTEMLKVTPHDHEPLDHLTLPK